MKKFLFLGALLLCFGLGSSFDTDPDIAYYIVAGRISTPDNLPAKGVLVYCIENPLQKDITNEDGNYCISVRHGQSVRIDESNYKILEGPSVSGPIRRNTKWDIIMEPKFAIVGPEEPGSALDSIVQDITDHSEAVTFP